MLIPFVSDPDFTLYVGDSLDVLRGLPDESVHCAATSPPFYALRDYGTGTWVGGDPAHEHDRVGARGGRGGSGTLDKRSADAMPSTVPASTCSCGAAYRDSQIGLEATPEEWVERLVEVFREVRRVLRPDGTLWIECGDSYNSGTSGSRKASTLEGSHGYWENPHIKHRIKAGGDIKPKDLMMTPFMLAFALRADGWYMRQIIPWSKPNAMPESAHDRCTTAHSYLFLLAKSGKPTHWRHIDGRVVWEKPPPEVWVDEDGKEHPCWRGCDYWFDKEAIGEEFSEKTNSRGRGIGTKQALEERAGTVTSGRNNASFGRATQGDIAPHLTRVPQTETLDGSEGEAPRGPDGRRATHVEKGPHSLQHRDGDRWPNERKNPRSVWTIPTRGYSEAHFATWPEALCERIIKAGCPVDGVVLDPFMGSGTTALVARRLGRRSIGIELNPEYALLASKRLSQLSLLAQDAA